MQTELCTEQICSSNNYPQIFISTDDKNGNEKYRIIQLTLVTLN